MDSSLPKTQCIIYYKVIWQTSKFSDQSPSARGILSLHVQETPPHEHIPTSLFGKNSERIIGKFYQHTNCSLSVQFSHSVVSDSLQPHGLQHTRLLSPSPSSRACSKSCPLSWWCHPNISSSVIPFSCCLQSFPASGSFQMSQLFASSGQGSGVSASTSVLPMNIQDWFPLGWTGWISLQSKGLSRVFSNTTVQKHQFFGAQLTL